MLFIFPIIGLIYSFFYGDWKPFKLSLFMALPGVILSLAIIILMTIDHFFKKWINRHKE